MKAEDSWTGLVPLSKGDVRAQQEGSSSTPGTGSSPNARTLVPCSWPVQPPEVWEINSCGLWATQSVEFCYRCLNGLRHCLLNQMWWFFLLCCVLFLFFLEMNVRTYVPFEQEVNRQNKETKSKASLEMMRNVMHLNEKKTQKLSSFWVLCSPSSQWWVDHVTAGVVLHFQG